MIILFEIKFWIYIIYFGILFCEIVYIYIFLREYLLKKENKVYMLSFYKYKKKIKIIVFY